jgi:hypothetical protein
MRAFGHVFLLICMAAAAVPRAQSPAADAAAAVLAAAREALGGEKKLAAVTSIAATGRTRQVRGDSLVPIEFELHIQLPDKYVRKDEIPAQESGPALIGFNGDQLLQVPAAEPSGARGGPLPSPPGAVAASASQGRGAPPEQQAAAQTARLATVKHDFARLALGMLAASPAYPLTFTYVGKAEAPQGTADVLDVKGPPGPGAFSGRLFVNADTHLPIMVTWTVPPPPNNASPPPESRLFFADYREVSGIQLPFRLRRALGSDTIEETTFDGFTINGKIDPKKFEVRK